MQFQHAGEVTIFHFSKFQNSDCMITIKEDVFIIHALHT